MTHRLTFPHQYADSNIEILETLHLLSNIALQVVITSYICISRNIYKRCKYWQDKLVSKLVMFPVSLA